MLDENKVNIECTECYAYASPDSEAKNSTTGEWDGHTYKFGCNCHDKNLRISIG